VHQHCKRPYINSARKLTYPWRVSEHARSFISPARRLANHLSSPFSMGLSSWKIALAPSNSFESHSEKYCAKVDVMDCIWINCSLTSVLAMAWSASKDAGFDFGSAEAICCSPRNVRNILALNESLLNRRRPWMDDRSDSKASGRKAYVNLVLTTTYFDDVELFFSFDSMFFSQFEIDCFCKRFCARRLKLEIQVHHFSGSGTQISCFLFRCLSFLP